MLPTYPLVLIHFDDWIEDSKAVNPLWDPFITESKDYFREQMQFKHYVDSEGRVFEVYGLKKVKLTWKLFFKTWSFKAYDMQFRPTGKHFRFKELKEFLIQGAQQVFGPEGLNDEEILSCFVKAYEAALNYEDLVAVEWWSREYR